MFFEKNCQALLSNPNNTGLVEALKTTSMADNLAFEETADGGITIEVDGVCLHNPAGAITESQALCHRYCQPGDNTLTMILGMGLGYLLQQACLEVPTGTKCVYEPNAGLLRFVLEHVDLSEQLGTGQTVVFTEPEQTQAFFSDNLRLGEKQVNFLVLPGYMQWQGENLNNMLKIMLGSLETASQNLIENIPIGTSVVQADAVAPALRENFNWIRQFLLNTPHYADCIPYTELSNQYQGFPAIVVGTGPSLQNALPALKEIQHQAVIVAVGRALKPLLDAGITPDFAVFADAEASADQLENLPTQPGQTAFVVGPFAHDSCFEAGAKTIYWANFEQYPHLRKWLEKALESPQSSVDTRGTVSYLAAQTAVTLGCNSLILVGQDLALPAEKYAGADNSDDHAKTGKIVIFRPAEQPTEETSEWVETEGQNGETLKTSPDYLAYARYFEEFASKHPELTFYNASVGGAKLAGYQSDTLENIMATTGLLADARLKPELLAGGTAKENDPKTEKKLYDALFFLDEQIQQALLELDPAVKILRALTQNPPSTQEWPDRWATYNRHYKRLMTVIESQPIIYAALANASYDLNQVLEHLSDDEYESRRQMLAAMLQFTETCQAIFERCLYGWVCQALGGFDTIHSDSDRGTTHDG